MLQIVPTVGCDSSGENGKNGGGGRRPAPGCVDEEVRRGDGTLRIGPLGTNTCGIEEDVHDRKVFREKWFPRAGIEQWNDWKWQIANRIRCGADLRGMFSLSPAEERALAKSQSRFPVAITPYYASLLDTDNAGDPLRRTVIPVDAEAVASPGESDDPLHEDGQSPVPGIVHRYPDRVLFLVTSMCATYCRYCTRSRMVGGCSGPARAPRERWEAAIEYIAAHKSIRDVLISGGDPLTLSNDHIQRLLHRLRAIAHVEIIRIGTKVPVVLPQRIDRPLVRMLKTYHPLWMSIHVTHPQEITPEVKRACERLADAGVPLGSQTVLLSGINDSVETLRSLFHKLMMIRVRPYYLYQCDPVTGLSHFRTPVSRGAEIIGRLQGFTSGYAVPRFVVDAPGGGGKIPLETPHRVGEADGSVLLRNYRGDVYEYPAPEYATAAVCPKWRNGNRS